MAEQGADIAALGEVAIEFHGTALPEEFKLWRNGLNLLLRGLDPIAGAIIQGEEQTIQIALLVQAWNFLFAANDLAIRAYYGPALNLLRSPVEFWMAYWYLRTFPEQYNEFTNPAVAAPKFDTMLRRISRKHRAGPQTNVGKWIDRLHPFSHVSREAIALALDRNAAGFRLVLGPATEADLFRYCTSEAIVALIPLTEAVENFRLVMGVSEPFETKPIGPKLRKRVTCQGRD